MSNYPGVTKVELERDLLPVVRKWLEDTGRTIFNENGRDTAEHEVYSFGVDNNPSDMDAYVVYEGWGWVLDFIEEHDGSVLGRHGRVYEVEAYTSYEMNVTILDDDRE